MDIGIKEQLFIVTGASSGFGRSVAEKLMKEGALVLGIARREEKLKEIHQNYTEQFEYLAMDLTVPGAIKKIKSKLVNKQLSGIFVNAGGPPAMSFDETGMKDWDDAYKKVLRWKIEVVKGLLNRLEKQKYGRVLFLESSSVKQPIENMALSNSLRMAVVGMAKTLSQEVAKKGITVNVLAPGAHNTNAIDRLIKKKCQKDNISFENAKKIIEENTKVGSMGNPDDLATLAVWLLSPLSGYVTGQAISVAGGVISSVFG